MLGIEEKNSIHKPVMLNEICEYLTQPFLNLPAASKPHWLLDLTLGGGGHTGEMLKIFAGNEHLKKNKILAIDKDPQATKRAGIKFQKEIKENILLIKNMPFGKITDFMRENPVLAVLADLGFSSDQLEDENRGLSFQKDGPLDMRLDPKSNGPSCLELLETIGQTELENILKDFGEERFAKNISQKIIWARSLGQLPKTTKALSSLIIQAIPPAARHKKIHASTRSFQALRIAVNNELEELDNLLNHAIINIQAGGRIAIISFHSLEDRKVKLAFKDLKKKGSFTTLTKKPLGAKREEKLNNPRSRSAKLRITEKL